jgi:hypothetical protein
MVVRGRNVEILMGADGHDGQQEAKWLVPVPGGRMSEGGMGG